jgi:hypothetical protein
VRIKRTRLYALITRLEIQVKKLDGRDQTYKETEKLIKRLGERAGIIDMEIRTRPLEGDRVRVSAALLYAYIGYQKNDQGVVDAGLKVVSELGTDSDRRFAGLLQQLWLEPDTSGNP